MSLTLIFGCFTQSDHLTNIFTRDDKNHFFYLSQTGNAFLYKINRTFFKASDHDCSTNFDNYFLWLTVLDNNFLVLIFVFYNEAIHETVPLQTCPWLISINVFSSRTLSEIHTCLSPRHIYIFQLFMSEEF